MTNNWVDLLRLSWSHVGGSFFMKHGVIPTEGLLPAIHLIPDTGSLEEPSVPRRHSEDISKVSPCEQSLRWNQTVESLEQSSLAVPSSHKRQPNGRWIGYCKMGVSTSTIFNCWEAEIGMESARSETLSGALQTCVYATGAPFSTRCAFHGSSPFHGFEWNRLWARRRAKTDRSWHPLPLSAPPPFSPVN